MSTASGGDVSYDAVSMASIDTTSSTPANPMKRRKNARKVQVSETTGMAKALTEFMADSRRARAELVSDKPKQKDATDLLFENLAMRMKMLPVDTQSFVQIQLAQIFFNAENRNLEPMPVTPLPRVVPVEPQLPNLNADRATNTRHPRSSNYPSQVTMSSCAETSDIINCAMSAVYSSH